MAGPTDKLDTADDKDTSCELEKDCDSASGGMVRTSEGCGEFERGELRRLDEGAKLRGL